MESYLMMPEDNSADITPAMTIKEAVGLANGEKVECDLCGRSVRRDYLAKHQKTKVCERLERISFERDFLQPPRPTVGQRSPW